ncbi:uncharacterized protein [Clytia hemisphaerica]|uniref:Uncharacterized protein n=1 Tax=Clytia hemisphaerica TaxID=252671 RepID=A0A7M5V6C1_9CNID
MKEYGSTIIEPREILVIVQIENKGQLGLKYNPLFTATTEEDISLKESIELQSTYRDPHQPKHQKNKKKPLVRTTTWRSARRIAVTTTKAPPKTANVLLRRQASNLAP